MRETGRDDGMRTHSCEQVSYAFTTGSVLGTPGKRWSEAMPIDLESPARLGRHLALALAALLFSAGEAVAYNNGIAGRAGVPSDGGITCAECHGGGGFSGFLHLDLPETFAYDESYEIAVILANPGKLPLLPELWGFSLIAIDDATGEPVGGTGAGGISPGAGSQLSSFGSSEEWDYAVQTGNGVGGTITVVDGGPGWVLNWTAPSDSVESVTFYATFNAANGNGNFLGDSIFAKTVTVPVPEPGATAGLLLALGALRALRRRR